MRIFLTLIMAISLTLASDSKLIPSGEIAPGIFLRDMNNGSFFLSKTVGDKAKPDQKSPVVLSFFASWCIPCRTEIPFLMEMQEKYPDIAFYLINVSEEKSVVNDYIKKMSITLPVLLDSYGMTAKKYKVADESNNATLPGLYIIDSNGNIVMSHQGFDEEQKAYIEEILSTLQ